MKSKYVMNDIQVENFARDMATAVDAVQSGRTTYLRVLVTACQAVLGKVRRGKLLAADTQLDVLNDQASHYYAAVLRGVTTPDVADAEGLDKAERTRRSIERNKRSTFARNSKSTLVAWVSAGGDLRTLSADEVTRDPLLAEVRAKRGQRAEGYAMQRAQRAIIREVRKLSKADLGAARADLEEIIEALSEELDALANGNRDTSTITQVIQGRPVHSRQPRPTSRLQG